MLSLCFPLGDIFEQNARMHQGEGDQDDIERHASEWIEANRDTFDGWIEAASQAATQ
jgi:glycine betaine/proline transport system substrate-binding protein